MGQLDYDVVYLTKETLNEIELRLARSCVGQWGLRRLNVKPNDRVRTFEVQFERECDITVLCQPTLSVA